MAFTTGLATDHNDLLVQFRAWILTQGWSELRWIAPVAGNPLSMGELCLQGPGYAPDQLVYANIQTWGDNSNLRYGWELRGAMGFTPSLVWGAQPNESPATYLLVSSLASTSLAYWFYANDRRFIIVVKFQTVYTSCHVGFFLPWATPAQYPFPLLVAGNCYGKAQPTWTDAGNRFFVDPTTGSSSDFLSGSMWLRRPIGGWKRGANHVQSTANNNITNSISIAFDRVWIWPYNMPYIYTNNIVPINWCYSGPASAGAAFDNLQPTAQGERIVMPVYLMDLLGSGYGAIDGVMCPFGIGLTPEQTVLAGGKVYRAFPNVHRVSGDDFMLIEES